MNKHKVLEITDGCDTPEQLLKSSAFSGNLTMYKEKYIENLKNRSSEIGINEKIDFISTITAEHVLNILLKKNKDKELTSRVVDFVNWIFHNFRGSDNYTRLTRLHNEIVSERKDDDTSIEWWREQVTNKSKKLANLILETHRKLNNIAWCSSIHRSAGSEPSPKVTAVEISGQYLKLPPKYFRLAGVPLTFTADVFTWISYETPSNKRTHKFHKLKDSPLDFENFSRHDWCGIPLNVWWYFIVAYINKARWCIEMEPWLLNLFPLANINMIEKKQPDWIFMFGVDAPIEKLWYFEDSESNTIEWLVPKIDELKYFWYLKKPILTLHNIKAIENKDIPLHCGSTRYVVRFDKKWNPYIDRSHVIADDMWHIKLEETKWPSNETITKPVFYGTEIWAFACLDDFSPKAKEQMEWRYIWYNRNLWTNSRQIVPITNEDAIATWDPVDLMLYMNNYDLSKKDGNVIDTSMNTSDAFNFFREWKRVAAWTTGTDRWDIESSYWANPFPHLKEGKKTPDTRLYKQFQESEAKFETVVENLKTSWDIQFWVAYSQMMAGVNKNNTDEDLEKCWYKIEDRSQISKIWPEKLAKDLIDRILDIAKQKRKKLWWKESKVNITVVLVWDSRTWKSETAMAMDWLLYTY